MPYTARQSSWLSWLWGSALRMENAMSPSQSREPHAAVLAEIRGLADLEAGWNSYSACPIDDRARASAEGFVRSLTDLGRPVPDPSVAPTPDGGVALSWHVGPREVQITFLPLGGEYVVAEANSPDIIREGRVERVNLLKDIIGQYVVPR